MHGDIGQLLWVGFTGTTTPDRLARLLARGEVGATVLFKRNLATRAAPGGGAEVLDLDAIADLVAALRVPAPDGTLALVAVDQEGGVVQRVRAPATVWPPMLRHERLAAPEDVEVAEAVGRAMGDELRALGFDLDFAPVLDVHTNPANPIIGDRAFGTTPEAVSRRALAFARGLAAAGILACGKHFPGHGDTTTDSHLELPRVDHPWPRLEAIELAPFAAAAAAGMPLLMTAHVVFAALDAAVPATLSPRVMTELVRGRLGYRGVIVSDDLDMKAIAGDVGGAAVAAIRAGCDALLLCRDEANQDAAFAALARAAEADAGFRARVGEAAARVRAMKAAHLEARARRPPPGRDVVGAAAHRALAARLAGG